jgi:hypothetical protein
MGVSISKPVNTWMSFPETILMDCKEVIFFHVGH